MSRKVTLFLFFTFLLTWALEFAAIAWIGDFSIVNQPGSGFPVIVLIFIACVG